MAYELEKLFAEKLIARRDIMAEQVNSKVYMPRERAWTRHDITQHIAGEATYGHYMIDPDGDTTKLICFDIDLRTGEGYLPTRPMPIEQAEFAAWERSWQLMNIRDAWRDRKFPGRDMMKFALRGTAATLMRVIYDTLELPTAMAYSGSKGLHVYALPGRLPAHDAREGGRIVLDVTEQWKLAKGHSTYRHVNEDPLSGSQMLEIEVYPKQDTLDGSLGNLLRLPLGVNRKAPKDPTFFLDPRAPAGQWVPADPIWALTTTNPWED